jgi:methylaspartate mutase sigma subunit
MSGRSPIVVFGVVGNDIHVVANRVLELCLKAGNFDGVNLGTNNLPENFADAALECCADAVLIASLNGEAPHWCRKFRELFEARNIGDTIIYLGGNLVTGDMPSDEVEKLFRAYGIDRVYHGVVDFDEILVTLRKDIADGHAKS